MCQHMPNVHHLDCVECTPTPPSPPFEPTTAEAFAAVRRQVDRLRRKPEWLSTNDERELDDSLALLERRMQDTPPLAVLVEAFCLDVEASDAAQEAKKRGGQQAPFHGPFCHLQPSARSELNRWARDFREALKKQRHPVHKETP